MKETTKRLLLIIIPIVLIISCILSVAGSVGGYWYYSNAKKKAQEQAERKADKEFSRAYRRWLTVESRGVYLGQEWEATKLDKEYNDVLRVQINDANANKNNEEVLRLCDLVKANWDKKERAYKNMQNELLTRDEAIQNLNEKAQKLSTEEKRKRGLKIASLAREKINLNNKAISLLEDDITIGRRVNELYQFSAKGHVTVSSFNEDLKNYQSEDDRLKTEANEQMENSNRAGDQIADEWAKLKPLLKR